MINKKGVDFLISFLPKSPYLKDHLVPVKNTDA